MNSEIKIFNNSQFGEIRTATTEIGEPLFCASDITKILGYKNGRKAIIDNCSLKGVTTSDTPTNGGIQQLTYINESNLYRLVMRSKLPEAEQFQDWVCDEVLPAIRKTGGYVASKPEDTPEIIMARGLMAAKDAIDRLKAQLETKSQQIALQQEAIKQQAPKVAYHDEVLNSEGSINITVIAKDLGMSAITLNKKLHNMGIIFKSAETWVFYNKYQDKGYGKTQTYPYQDSNGKLKTSIRLCFTEKGRQFIMGLFNQTVNV